MPFDPGTSPAIALTGYAIAYACVSACVLVTALAANDLGPRALIVVAIAALAMTIVSSRPPAPATAGLVLIALLAAGTSVGAALGLRIESAGHLLPVAIVSSVADAFSVLTPGAPTDVVADTPSLLSVLAIPWPMIGTTDLPAILGVGDVVFVALYVGAARRHALSLARTGVALALGLAATAIVVAVTAVPIPALPFLGTAMLVAHPEARRVPVADRRAAYLGIAATLVVFGALVVARLAR